jgi:hypothetical protein
LGNSTLQFAENTSKVTHKILLKDKKRFKSLLWAELATSKAYSSTGPNKWMVDDQVVLN